MLDLCLDRTDGLLKVADDLPGRLCNFRFAMEAATIVAIARKLSVELRRRDPLAERVVLTKAQYAACCAHGIGRGPVPKAAMTQTGLRILRMAADKTTQRRDASADDVNEPLAHVRRVVARSGTSFLWGMKVLPVERRRAMYAIYAFCREVDDVADEPGETAGKKRGLAAWREEIAPALCG